jgi:predicted Fe-S protein YdhL (DUF1289 family)
MIPQSPCIGVCLIEDNGHDDICIGCGRTMDEISNYPILNTPENIAFRREINAKALNRLQDD